MASELTHDEVRELLGAFALDAVEPDEAAHVQQHLAICDECAAEVANHREVAALLASEPVEVPAGPWERIAADLGAPSEVVPISAGEGRRKRLARRAPWILGIAAAIFAIGVIGLGGLAVHQQHRLDRLNDAIATIDSQHDIAAAAATAATAPGAHQVVLRDAQGGSVATVVLLRDGTGYLVPTGGMSPLGFDRTYQLWGVVGSEKISLAVLGNHPNATQIKVPTAVTTLAVTDEQGSGVVSSTRQPVAVAAV